MNQSEIHTKEYFPYQIGQVPKEIPGIYTWHFLFSSENKDFYHQAFYKEYDVEIKWYLKEKYKGRISREEAPINNSFDSEVGRLFSMLFCPPIYLGMSMNLGTRLNRHLKTLERLNQDGLVPQEDEEREAYLFALEDEKERAFANRISSFFRKVKFNNINSLYIKTVELPSYDRSQVRDLEQYFLKTYLPIYSRR